MPVRERRVIISWLECEQVPGTLLWTFDEREPLRLNRYHARVVHKQGRVLHAVADEKQARLLADISHVA